MPFLLFLTVVDYIGAVVGFIYGLKLMNEKCYVKNVSDIFNISRKNKTFRNCFDFVDNVAKVESRASSLAMPRLGNISETNGVPL